MWFIGSPVPRLLLFCMGTSGLTDARALHAFVVVFFWVGWGGRCWGYATLVNFGILELATGNAVGLELGVVQLVVLVQLFSGR